MQESSIPANESVWACRHLQGILLKELVHGGPEVFLKAIAVEGKEAVETLNVACAGLKPGCCPEVLEHPRMKVIPEETAPEQVQTSQMLACRHQPVASLPALCNKCSPPTEMKALTCSAKCMLAGRTEANLYDLGCKHDLYGLEILI